MPKSRIENQQKYILVCWNEGKNEEYLKNQLEGFDFKFCVAWDWPKKTNDEEKTIELKNVQKIILEASDISMVEFVKDTEGKNES